MSTSVFGCPKCQQPFQVAASQAGQVVQCPSCAQAVEISPDAFATQTPAAQPPASQAAQAFNCTSCGGQFGVTPDMNGLQVACPHCQAHTTIQLGPSPEQPATESQEDAFSIKTNTPISRKRKKNLKKGAKKSRKSKSIGSSFDADLFAPGHEQAEAAIIPPAVTPAPKVTAPAAKKPAATAPTATPTPVPPAPKTPPVPAQQNPLQPPTKNPTAQAAATSQIQPAPKAPPKPPTAKPNLADQSNSGATEQQSAVEKPAPPTTETTSAPASSGQPAAVQTISDDGSKPDTRPSIAHLLPPRFDVLDPTRMGVGRSKEQFKVFLPDGDGGSAQMDNRVLRVKHGAKEVSLVSLTPEQRAKQRLIQNIVAIVIGIIIIALAFTILM